MAEHYTKNTVSVTKYCKACEKTTTHSVFGGRVGSCEACIKRLEAEAKKPKPAPAAQQSTLFGA